MKVYPAGKTSDVFFLQSLPRPGAYSFYDYRFRCNCDQLKPLQRHSSFGGQLNYKLTSLAFFTFHFYLSPMCFHNIITQTQSPPVPLTVGFFVKKRVPARSDHSRPIRHRRAGADDCRTGVEIFYISFYFS